MKRASLLGRIAEEIRISSLHLDRLDILCPGGADYPLLHQQSGAGESKRGKSVICLSSTP